MKLILPSIAGDNDYDYVFRFHQLGNSQLDVLISPFVRPKAFWGSLFRRQCFYFISMLMLPAFLLAFKKCLIAFGSFVTLMFLCILASSQVQNICTQYQSEGVIVVFIAAVLAGGTLFSTRSAGCYFNFLSRGVLPGKTLYSRRVLIAALPAVFLSSLLSWYFFGENYYLGRSMLTNRLKACKKIDFLDEFYRVVPEGKRLAVTRQIGSQFLLRNDATWIFAEPLEYALIDLFELDPATFDLDKIRGKLLKSDTHKVLYNRIAPKSHYILFGPAEGKKSDYSKHNGIKSLNGPAWNAIPGKSRTFFDNAFAIKNNYIKKEDGLFLEIAVYLLKKVEYDIEVHIDVFGFSRIKTI